MSIPQTLTDDDFNVASVVPEFLTCNELCMCVYVSAITQSVVKEEYPGVTSWKEVICKLEELMKTQVGTDVILYSFLVGEGLTRHPEMKTKLLDLIKKFEVTTTEAPA